jgi:hypothetical protein
LFGEAYWNYTVKAEETAADSSTLSCKAAKNRRRKQERSRACDCEILKRAILQTLLFAHSAVPNLLNTPSLPEEIDFRIESIVHAERFIKDGALQIR